MSEFLEEDLVDEADTEIVHWMEPKRVSLGPVAVVGAFALGVVATLSALAIARWLETEEQEIRFRRL